MNNKAKIEPAPIRAHAVIKSFRETLSFEESQILLGWQSTYQGTIEDVQEVFDAVATSTPAGMSPVPPAALVFGSLIQIVTHNATLALINNPALLGNANIQKLFGVLEGIRNDKAIPKTVEDTPPFNLGLNRDGSVTVRALPQPEPEPEPEPELEPEE